MQFLSFFSYYYDFRILEFEIENLELSGGAAETIEVELWDCSGNQRFGLIYFDSYIADNYNNIFNSRIRVRGDRTTQRVSASNLMITAHKRHRKIFTRKNSFSLILNKFSLRTVVYLIFNIFSLKLFSLDSE